MLKKAIEAYGDKDKMKAINDEKKQIYSGLRNFYRLKTEEEVEKMIEENKQQLEENLKEYFLIRQAELNLAIDKKMKELLKAKMSKKMKSSRGEKKKGKEQEAALEKELEKPELPSLSHVDTIIEEYINLNRVKKLHD